MALATVTNGFQIKQGFTFSRSFWFGTTGQTVTVNLSKAGTGAFAVANANSGVATEIAFGWYYLILNANDTDTLGLLSYHCTAGAGGPLDFQDQVVTQTFSDAVINGSGNVIAAGSLRQNVALNAFPFLMTTSGVPRTGLTVTAQRSLGSGGFGACSNSPVELANGVYTINLSATDLSAATVTLRFTAPGADDNVVVLVLQP